MRTRLFFDLAWSRHVWNGYAHLCEKLCIIVGNIDMIEIESPLDGGSLAINHMLRDIHDETVAVLSCLYRRVYVDICSSLLLFVHVKYDEQTKRAITCNFQLQESYVGPPTHLLPTCTFSVSILQ